LLILPASVPIDEPAVQSELTRYLDDNWVPVIEQDVDGPYALPLEIDRDNPSFGRFPAARWVARTLLMCLASTLRTTNRGIKDWLVRLGCTQSGEDVATFSDTLRRLADRTTFLYVDGRRYWYSPSRASPDSPRIGPCSGTRKGFGRRLPTGCGMSSGDAATPSGSMLRPAQPVTGPISRMPGW
jgi:hypothetical protein